MATIVVLHDAPGRARRPDELDVWHQVDSVTLALKKLGHEVAAVPFGLDLASAEGSLRRIAPACVFNLVESVDGDASLNHLAPAWLEHWGMAYTGSSALAHLMATDKLVAKEHLKNASIPTPAWHGKDSWAPELGSEQVIIKPVREDASVGIDETSVVENSGPDALRTLVETRTRISGQSVFAEAYVEGREFSLALVGAQHSPEMLPAAEILFVGYEERKKPKVVGYAAKWLPESYEYIHTVRRHLGGAEESPLLGELARLGRAAWRHFGLRGYARIDCRVDAEGNPWVLEVNPNPCLSPDAGLAAAAEAHGWTYEGLIARILAAAS